MATKIEDFRVSKYKVPTATPEADGTFEWESTTLILVELKAANVTGLGYTYSDKAAGDVAEELVKKCVIDENPFHGPLIWKKLVGQTRNMGRSGLCAMSVSAIDIALWDLKAKLLGVPLVSLLGQCREDVDIYGSGGFTNYSRDQLESQMKDWVDQGLKMVKMKVGTHPDDDLDRVKFVRSVIGPKTQLFVDGNEAYDKKQALELATGFADCGVKWFEQPISAEDLDGMCELREEFPESMELATGEYAHDALRVHQILKSKACDVIQLDVTRCQGITGYLKGAAIAEGENIPLSAHCAPSLHIHLGCSLSNMRHLEFFFDHVRIERMFFDEPIHLVDGRLRPDLSRPGLGLHLKREDIQKFQI